MDLKSIKQINSQDAENLSFEKNFGDCVVLTYDNKILMQKRLIGEEPALNIFGGHIEKGESPIEGMIRELNEELGAIITEKDVTYIGSITEDFTCHKELVNVYFWHDKLGSITGCYEWDAVSFNTAEDAISQPEIMDYAIWSLKKCQELKLIK